jgi:hypothetical protein
MICVWGGTKMSDFIEAFYVFIVSCSFALFNFVGFSLYKSNIMWSTVKLFRSIKIHFFT